MDREGVLLVAVGHVALDHSWEDPRALTPPWDSRDRVLEVGTGSGYQAAVLSRLAQRVFTIEILAPLAERARGTLDSLGFENVVVVTGDGYRGLPDEAPFDGILVTAAPAEVPQPLLDQLAPGGRLVIPVGERQQWLRVYERQEQGIRSERPAVCLQARESNGPALGRGQRVG